LTISVPPPVLTEADKQKLLDAKLVLPDAK